MEIVVYVAHVDDDLFFAGGSILKWGKQGHTIHIVYAGNGIVVHGRPGHDYRAHAHVLQTALGAASHNFLNLPTMEFETYGQLALNKRFDALGLSYDMIVTHHPDDVNKDHRIVYESARVMSRYNSCSMICFDSIGALTDFKPNYYVNITDEFEKKQELFKIMSAEIHPYPHERSKVALKAKDMYRGSQVHCQYAEAFEARKLVTL